MGKRLLSIFSLVCAALLMTANTAQAQDLRPEDTGFVKFRVGLSNYLGDNEKSPFNFNGDGFDVGFPWNFAVELGYQFSVPFSVSLAYQLGDYPIITQFPPPPIRLDDDVADDPSTRSSIQLFGRYKFANARTKVAPYLNFGLAYSFGNATQNDPPNFPNEESVSAFGPLEVDQEARPEARQDVDAAEAVIFVGIELVIAEVEARVQFEEERRAVVEGDVEAGPEQRAEDQKAGLEAIVQTAYLSRRKNALRRRLAPHFQHFPV